jgi:hypothetical protein
MPELLGDDLRMYALGEQERRAGVPEVVKPYVGQPDERLGGSAGGATVPYLLARTYALDRTLIAPSGPRRTVKPSAVVVIGVDRYPVGSDNDHPAPLARTGESRRRNHRWVMRSALPDGIMPTTG